MRIGLILSNDWEVYGDGSGDFFDLQYEPTRALLAACERHGAKLTLMAEIGQQWAHQRLGEQWGWAREVTAAWERQARDAIRRGHDVQLHLHPQWHGAAYDGRWRLDYDRYCFATLPESEQAELTARGRRYLEALLSDVQADYRCVAFRAGGFMMEPSAPAIGSLTAAGIECDTSVCKGRYFRSQLGSYDYRGAHSHYEPWFVAPSDITRKAASLDGLLEIPVYSEPFVEVPALRKAWARLGRGWDISGPAALFKLAAERTGLTEGERQRHLAYIRKLAARYSVDQAPAQRAADQSFLRSLAGRLTRRSAVMLDYDSLMPSVAAAMLIRLHERLREHAPDLAMPVMAIGHVKSMVSTEYVEEFLTKARGALGEQLVFWTLQEAVRYTKPRLRELAFSPE